MDEAPSAQRRNLPTVFPWPFAPPGGLTGSVIGDEAQITIR